MTTCNKTVPAPAPDAWWIVKDRACPRARTVRYAVTPDAGVLLGTGGATLELTNAQMRAITRAWFDAEAERNRREL